MKTTNLKDFGSYKENMPNGQSDIDKLIRFGIYILIIYLLLKLALS